jgi:hypothetical protein
MCTYRTEHISLEGSGKGTSSWFAITEASVYFDHPQHTPADHTLNIDFRNPREGPSARIAVELSAASGRALAAAILASLSQD